MYSECPKCQTIFSVSEADIGAHHGLVRCGHCSSIFHALRNKVDDLRARSGDESAGEPDTVVPPAGEAVDTQQPAPSGPADKEAPAGAPSHEYRERDELDVAYSPAIQEDRDWEVSSPVEPDRAADRDDGTLIEPVLPDTRAAEDRGSAGESLEEPEREEPEREEPEWEEPEREEPELDESVLEEPVPEEPSLEEDTGFPGEITEEITIEAPPVLWNVFDEEVEEESRRNESTDVDEWRDVDGGSTGARSSSGESPPGARQGRAGRAAPAGEPETEAAPRRRTPLRSPYRQRDISMVELPQPRPFKTATLSLLTVLLALLLVWQVKSFYLDELAQVPALRPYLESLCRPLGCVLPPRQDFARIDLVGTSIDVNPEIPGALEIEVRLINRAGFPQPYPPLRVTLTDREGRVVGRRTYVPAEYRGDADGLLPENDVRSVSINLAQPAENAVGYEVELMAPARDGG